MALLKSVDHVPGIQYYEYRDKKYFNQYKYRAKFELFGVRYLYKVETKNDLLKKLNQSNAYWASIPIRDRDKVTENVDDLISFVNWRKTNSGKKTDCTVRVEGSSISVFSNDLSLLQTVPSISQKITVEYTEAITSEYAGTKYFSNTPAHKYRVYFKNKRIEESFVNELADFFDKHESLVPCKSFKKWLANEYVNTWKMKWLHASYSVDYDDETMISYLALVYGDILGHRYKLEKHPDLT